MREANVQKNTVYNVIKSAASIIFPLISFPYASRTLLTESIGKVNFGGSVVSYFTLIASLGITTYAVRECARVKQDSKKLSETASQLFSINLMTTVVAYLLLGITLLVARPLDEYRTLIVIQSTAILFTTIGADWLNTAMEDFRFITIRTVLFQVLSLLLMFTFVHSPDDYLTYAAISVTSSSGANLTNVFYRKRYCKIRFTRNMDLKRHMPSILLLFSLILSQTIYVNSDTTILGLFCGDNEVGLYSTAVKIYNIVNTMVASVAFVVMPKLSSGYAKKDYAEINSLLRYGLNFIVVLGLPCIVGLNAIAADIIEVMAGSAYLASVPMLHVLTIALTLSFLGGFIGNLILIPSGRERICLLSSLISAAVNLILNLIFIPFLGGVAAAGTTAIAEGVGLLIGFRHVEKDIVLGRLRDIFGAPLLGCLGIVLVIWLISSLVQALLLRTVLCIAVSAVVYLAVLVLMKHDFTITMLRKVIK